MIQSDKNDGTFTICCDTCGRSEIFDTAGDWREMLAEVRIARWRMRKEDETWFHYCPECKGRL